MQIDYSHFYNSKCCFTFCNSPTFRNALHFVVFFSIRSLKEHDKIKIIVRQYVHNENNIIHPKSYHFKFKESEKITIHVNYKNSHEIRLFKRKRRATAGMYFKKLRYVIKNYILHISGSFFRSLNKP